MFQCELLFTWFLCCMIYSLTQQTPLLLWGSYALTVNEYEQDSSTPTDVPIQAHFSLLPSVRSPPSLSPPCFSPHTLSIRSRGTLRKDQVEPRPSAELCCFDPCHRKSPNSALRQVPCSPHGPLTHTHIMYPHTQTHTCAQFMTG